MAYSRKIKHWRTPFRGTPFEFWHEYQNPPLGKGWRWIYSAQLHLPGITFSLFVGRKVDKLD